MPNLRVYVPKEPSGIAVGSAVVGQPTGRQRIRVDYEGDLYGRGWSFAERLHHAAGRHLTEYPTVARSWLQPEDLIPVGRYESDSGDLVLDDERAAEVLGWWLGAEAGACEARLPDGEAMPLDRLACQDSRDPDGPLAATPGDDR